MSSDRNAYVVRDEIVRPVTRDLWQVASTEATPSSLRFQPSRDHTAIRLSGDAESVRATKWHRIAIHTEGKVIFIDAADAAAVEAHGKYSVLRMSSGSYRIRESVSTLAERLRPFGFIQIHRSTIVNASLVEELRVFGSGEMLLCLKGGAAEYRVSRRYRRSVKSIASCWI
jgi:two-component system, LytTR family, response regulator